MSLQEQYKRILNRDNKVLNISHKDLDGAASTIVTMNVFRNIEFVHLKYGEVNEFMRNLDYSKYDTVLLTDISPETEEAFSFSDKIFLIDHHDSALKYNNPSENRIVISGKSACLLCKDFFEKLFNINLSYLNDFSRIVNDYDMWILSDPKSWCYNELYHYYSENAFRKRFRNGDPKFAEDEQKYILERKKLLNETFREVEPYDFDTIKANFYFGGAFVNDVCHKLLKDNKLTLTMCVNPRSKSCSVRACHTSLHVGEILQALGYGGGHKDAGAFRFSDHIDMQDKLNSIEKYIFNNFKDMRR